jgi:hypothetical protein
VSPYTEYDPFSTNVLHTSTAPLTEKYNQGVSYILAPLHWNLTANEKIVVKLPSAAASLPGYYPISSTFDVMDNPVNKKSEMNATCTWGELVAGNGYPNSGTNNLKNFYSKATKTYTLQGPMTIPVNTNPAYPWIMNYGSPMFVMNVVKSHTFNLVQGWNLVSMPLDGMGIKASTLGLSSGDTVARYDSALMTYKTFVVGLPLNDFVMEPSMGYWIYAASAKSITVQGVVPWTTQSRSITVPTGGGWALIGFTSDNTGWKAANVPSMYTGGITTVVKWNAATQAYVTYVVGLPLNNFNIVPGEGYWVYCSGSGTLSYAP